MFQMVTIDQAGRIALPKSLLEALGLRPSEEVTLRLTDEGLLIEPKKKSGPITARIASMNLPVSDWEAMEKEIEEGRLV